MVWIFSGVVIPALLMFFAPLKTHCQTVVDKTVAIVSDGVKTELITYSDLLWQLALQPNVPLAPPSSQDLNIALQITINQRLIALEAERLPQPDPTDEQIKRQIERVLERFPSAAEFEKRLRLVGFDSIKDENFEAIMEQRVAIDKYVDFRFGAFAVITPEDEAAYYRETFLPEFRRRNPGIVVPALDEVREQVNQVLTERKKAADIEKFLDDAKRRAEIIILNEV